MDEDRKNNLIRALRAERQSFNNRAQDTTDHDLAISFLETGVTSADKNQWELLGAVIDDLDGVYFDYDC